MNNKAFTLIELLVVVLIIGILAAIALPQYTKTVEKSRMAEAQTMMKALSDAANRYYMQNNTYGGIDISSTGNLDIEIPAPGTSRFEYGITVTPSDTDPTAAGKKALADGTVTAAWLFTRRADGGVINTGTGKNVYGLQTSLQNGGLSSRICFDAANHANCKALTNVNTTSCGTNGGYYYCQIN